MDFGTQSPLYTSMPEAGMRPLQWVTIDPQHVHTLWKIHTENPLAVRCRNYVLDHLFSSNLEVLNSAGDVLSFEPQFDNFFQRRYKEFCYNAYDMYMVLGVVPVVLIQDENGHYYPCVPKYGTFVLQCAYAVDRERMYFRVLRPKALKVYKTGEGNGIDEMRTATTTRTFGGMFGQPSCTTSYNLNGVAATGGPITSNNGGLAGGLSGWVPDESVHIITGLGSDPGVGGELRSPLASVVSDLILTSSLTRYMLLAEHRMTNPLVTMQFHKTEDPDDLSKYRPVAGGTFFDADNIFTVDRQVVDAVDAQLRAIKEHLYHRDLEAAHNLGVQNQMLTSMDSARVQMGEGTVCIPKGLEHVKNDANVTQAGRQYMSQKTLTDDHISGLYGIPLPLMRNAGALRGNIAGQNEIFRNTLIKFAKLLGDMSSAAYMAIYVDDEGEYCSAMFGRKAIVDDTQFVSHGVEEAERNGVEVIHDDSETAAPPPPLADVVMPESKDKVTEAGDEAPQPATSNQDLASAVAALIKENEVANARAVAMRKRKRAEDAKPAPGKRTRVDEDARPVPGRRKRVGEHADATTGFVVKINVTHLMNDKGIQHLFEIGAIDLRTYQNMMLNRNGFSASQLKKVPTDAQKLIGDLLRDPSAEAPRADVYTQDGVGLRDLSKGHRRVVPTGVLLELAQYGGDVEKWEVAKREQEHEAQRRATKAVAKKTKADGKKEAKDKKKAKKADAKAAAKKASTEPG